MTSMQQAPTGLPETGRYLLRRATPADLAAVRALVLDVTARDLGYGDGPAWHRDLDRAAETDPAPGRVLFVAVDRADGDRVVACAGVRPGGPTSPAAMVEQYAGSGAVAQLAWVATDPAHRRRGLARRLAEACRACAADAGYDVLWLHTDTRTPAALPFWLSLGAVVVHDERGRGGDPRLASVHLELPLGGASEPVPSPVDRYLAGLPGSVRARVEQVRRLVTAAVPGAAETIRYGTPAFTVDGRSLVSVTVWTRHVALHPLPQQLADPELQAAVAPYRSAEDAMHLPHREPLPDELVRRVVEELASS
jgi:uncharacterized protein YdhG (YjbR/CyaY superfamily)/GNAT superfamily N-acetyltransferase